MDRGKLACPVCTSYLFVTGYRVITTPLPSGGPVLISMLNILDGFKFSKEDRDKSLTYHYVIEVTQLEHVVGFFVPGTQHF